MIEIGLGHYLSLGAIIFFLGTIGIFLNRKNVIVILMSIFLKFPALAGIVFSTLVAALIGVFYQDFELSHAVSAIMMGFNTEMLNGREISHLMPLSDDLNVLLNRGGINSMLSAMIIVISAILLMGAMEASGIINYIVDKLLKAANTIFKLSIFLYGYLIIYF